MRTVTIALLCFLLLVALDIGRVVASSEFFPLVVRSLQIAVSYLYWEICWEVYYQCTHNFEGVPLYLRFITSHLRLPYLRPIRIYQVYLLDRPSFRGRPRRPP